MKVWLLSLNRLRFLAKIIFCLMFIFVFVKTENVSSLAASNCLFRISDAENETLCLTKDIVLSYHITKDPPHLRGNDGRKAVFLINMLLSEASGKEFALLTRKNVGKQLFIYLGDKLLTAPVIQTPIYGAHVQVFVQSREDLDIILAEIK